MKETTTIGTFLSSLPSHENLFQKTIEGKERDRKEVRHGKERKSIV